MPLLALHDLTPRERTLLQRTETLADTLRQHAAAADRAGDAAPPAVQALKASGYPALTVPAELGGDGASLHEFATVQQCLGRADASLALIAAMNAHVLGGVGEGGGWPAPLYRHVAHAAVTRGALTNALASEPELGSPSRGGLPRTTATPTAGGWHITGHKTWSTGAPALDFLVVIATAPGDQVRRYLIPADAPGVRIERTWGDGLALRGSSSHDVVFDEVFVPDEHAIPPVGAASPSASAWFWTATAATYLGVGEGALHALAQYTRERTPSALGRPIATLEDIQQAVGRIELGLAAAEALLRRATRAWSHTPEQRDVLLPALAAAKVQCVNAVVHATDLALRTAGGAALSRSLPLERFFRDARAGLMHPPAEVAALTMIGRARVQDAEPGA